jgi:dTDP-4-amino-4,6-dideoxygalactose transaminase
MAIRPDVDLPAVFGGAPAFPRGIPVARPAVPDPDAVADEVRDILRSGVLTNGPHVRELERRTAEYLGVRHCVAVSSCTSGLMLVLRAADLAGDVVVPSFTFAATAHAVSWNGLRPVFADVDPRTLTMSVADAARAVGFRASAVLATHVYGAPADVEGLAEVCGRSGIRLFFDAAHAFGARHGDRPIGGFGDAEVFSLSPTKTLVAGEGGIIATNDDQLAERCRIGRDYGNPGDYDCRFVGLNARMSELHAALALGSLQGLDERVDRRNRIARLYLELLEDVPGLSFPAIGERDRSTYKDFTILVDPELFGADATWLGVALSREGIETRRYFSPPVHRMAAYASINGHHGHLQVTEDVSSRVLTLPMWSDLTDEDVLKVGETVIRVQNGAATRNARG